MRKLLTLAVLSLATAGGLVACTPGAGPGADAPTGTSSSTAPNTPTSDSESTVPAPPPSAPTAPHAGPGTGNAELVITVKPSESEAAVRYTLACQDGIPSAESQHPTAAAACAALKSNAALLSPAPRGADVLCTQQYGGPQQATVTGVVDGIPVDSSFALSDGCEISAWNAAKDVLGATGGAF